MVALAYAFRPFFIACAAWAVVCVPAWLALLLLGKGPVLAWPSLYWHSHEMIFGLVPAAIAGFLLTAMTNWTGAAPLRGARLLGLVLLWLAGRVAMWCSVLLPAWLVALVDGLFLPVVGLYAGVILLRHKSKRNYGLPLLLLLMALANVLMHLAFMQGQPGWFNAGQQLGMDSLALLIAVIAGRIAPAFSRNWLRRQGHNADDISMDPRLARLSLFSLALLLPAGLFWPSSPWTAWLVLLAVVINLWRMIGWKGWRVASDPLLLILHLAYLWLIVALALRGLAGIGLPVIGSAIPASLWLHAFGVGAVGVLLVGVMSRVALGHTGRPLVLPPGGTWMYVLINVAALLRMATAMGWMDARTGWISSGVCWTLAFALYLWLYVPILLQPRPDGKPG